MLALSRMEPCDGLVGSGLARSVSKMPIAGSLLHRSLSIIPQTPYPRADPSSRTAFPHLAHAHQRPRSGRPRMPPQHPTHPRPSATVMKLPRHRLTSLPHTHLLQPGMLRSSELAGDVQMGRGAVAGSRSHLGDAHRRESFLVEAA